MAARRYAGVEDEVLTEPLYRERGDFFERSLFLEEMRRARNGDELARGANARIGLAIELDDMLVTLADDEHRGRGDALEIGAREVGAPAARDDGAHAILEASCGDERGGGAGARAEVAHRESARIVVHDQPVGGFREARREKLDIEAQMAGIAVLGFLFRGEQIEEKRADAGIVDRPGDLAVARAQAARAAAVGEDHGRGA